MNNIQDKIAKWIMSHCKRCHYEVEEQTALLEASSILALIPDYGKQPSGLEIAKKCPCNCNHHPASSCCNCINGEIARDLTNDEAIEIAKNYVENYLWLFPNDENKCMVLKDGGRVRAKV